MYKKYFCAFADSKMSRSLRRIKRQVENIDFFDNIYIYNENSLDSLFKEKIPKEYRGYGYWMWKPKVILQTLEKMQEGDVLLYSDVGCHFNIAGLEKLKEYFDKTYNSELGIGATQFAVESKNKDLISMKHLEKEWTKGDIFDFFNVRNDESVFNTGQFQATIIFIRKTKDSINFIEKWLSVFENNFNLIDDSPSVSENFDSFKENRHDQSIFSVLLKKQKSSPFVIPASEVEQKKWSLLSEYPILAKRDRGLSILNRIKRKIKNILRDNKKSRIMCFGGGLGNQMFQYAFLLNISSKNNFVAEIDYSDTLSKEHNGFELYNIFGIEDKKISKFNKIIKKFFFVGPFFYLNGREINFVRIFNYIISLKSKTKKNIFGRYIEDNRVLMENNFHRKYLDILFGNKKNLYFYGTFQSHKYFENIKEKVFKTFSFPEIQKKDIDNFLILEKIKNSESVSIHVRRGDYLEKKWDYINVCDHDYYKRAFIFLINKIHKEKIKVFIFSDDINWCKQNLLFLKKYNVYFIDWNKGKNSYKDMYLMSMCKHNIIPNSTFSWWGAYLNINPNKIVISPKYWFKGIKTTKDRVPEEWFLL